MQVTQGSDIDQLAEQITALGVPAKLIVVDTLARCFVGQDENSAQAMGQFVAGIDRLRTVTGAAVVVVHHSGKEKDGKPEIERGSSALRAATDMLVSVTMDRSKLITVKNVKQKEDEEFQPMKLRLEQVQLGSDPKPTTSCVLRRAEQIPDRTQTLPTHLRMTLQALAACPNGEASVNEWRARATSTERTIHTHRNELIEKGLVERRHPKGRYAITERGRWRWVELLPLQPSCNSALAATSPLTLLQLPPPL